MPSFRSLVGRAHWAKRALIASVVLPLVALAADFQQWTLTKRLAAGDATSDEMQRNDHAAGVASVDGAADHRRNRLT